MNDVFAAAVYIVAAVTCLTCMVLQVRGYRRSKVRLLLWSALFFGALTVDNVILFFDLSVYPEANLAVWRHAATLTGLCLLLFGLIWDSD